MTLFQGSPSDRMTIAKQLTAEKKTERFITGKGVVTKWEKIRKSNHYLDALSYACVIGHYCGMRLVKEEEKPRPPAPKPRPQAKPFIDVTRWRENNAWRKERR